MGGKEMKDKILNGMAETYFYNCAKCKKGNLSRDEVAHIDVSEPNEPVTRFEYFCDVCMRVERSLVYKFKCYCGYKRNYKSKKARNRCAEIHIQGHQKNK